MSVIADIAPVIADDRIAKRNALVLAIAQALAGGNNIVSANEPYALAFSFTSANMNIAYDGTNASLTWPAYPAGFHVEATAELSSPAWASNQLPAVIFTNGMNLLPIDATNAMQFFRLRQL